MTDMFSSQRQCTPVCDHIIGISLLYQLTINIFDDVFWKSQCDTKYNYCPTCGCEINWNYINRQIADYLEQED